MAMKTMKSMKIRALSELSRIMDLLEACRDEVRSSTTSDELKDALWDAMDITDEECCFKVFRNICDDVISSSQTG